MFLFLNDQTNHNTHDRMLYSLQLTDLFSFSFQLRSVKPNATFFLIRFLQCWFGSFHGGD